MKNILSKARKSIILLFLTTICFPLFAQEATSVFGSWRLDKEDGSSIEVVIHSAAQKGNFPYKEDKISYGGAAVANEYFEYVAYYTFGSVETEDGNLAEVSYEKEDCFDNTVQNGILIVKNENGVLTIDAQDDLLNNAKLTLVKAYEYTNASSDEGGGDFWQGVLEFLLSLLFIAALLGSAGHMIYILTRPKRFNKVYTVEDFKEMRRNAGKSEESSDEEDSQAAYALEHSTDSWKYFKNEEGEDDFCATNKKMINALEAGINEAVALMPTDPDIVEGINTYGELLNMQWKRKFSGNKILIVIGIAVIALMIFAGGWQGSIFFIFSLGLYILSSFKPQFMHNKDAFRKSGKFSYGALAAVFAFIGSAQTVRTVTKWSDGTTTVDDDHSQHWIHLALGLIILIIIGFFLFVWALFNYLRNYVLYW